MNSRDQPNSSALRLYLLGGFTASRGQEIVPDSSWHRTSAKTLVKLLSVEPSHRLHREQLLELLWPDLDADAAAVNLRRALHFARHALEPELHPKGTSSFLSISGDLIVLNPGSVWVDADEFEAMATTALVADDPDAMEGALVLYRGDLLPEERYEDWAASRRAHLVDVSLQLRLRLSDHLVQKGELKAAINRLQEALHHDPAREDLHRQIMYLHATKGSRHEAILQYQACRDALQRELEVAPEPETEQLYEDIVAGGLAKAPRSPDATFPSSTMPQTTLPLAARHDVAAAFIGRERALQLVARSVSRADGGRGTAILVGGEAGVGKSRLASEVARAAYEQGSLVAWGTSYEHESRLPYGPFVDALDAYVVNLENAEQKELAGRHPDLVQLLPSLAGRRRGVFQNSDGIIDRTRLFALVARFLSDLAKEQTLVLVLDDLHTADIESLQLFHYLARSASTRRWLLLATYREEDVDVGSEFHGLAVTATRTGTVSRIDLLRLSEDESARVAAALLPGGHIDSAVLDHLYALSLGNPLFLQEIVADLQERGALVIRSEHWALASGNSADVPGRIQDLVEARVSGMGETVRRTLALAATAGMEFSFDELRGAAAVAYGPALDEVVLLDALDRALEVRVLEEQGDRYVFRHPLFRAALYERLSQARRTRLHTVLAETIEQQRPESIEVLAHHYANSANCGKAAHYLERFGDQAGAIYANPTAIGAYHAARDRLGGGSDAGGVSRIDEKLGDAYFLVGKFASARHSYSCARENAVDAVRRVDLWRKEGHAWEKQGEYEQCFACYQNAELEAKHLNEDSPAVRARVKLSYCIGFARYLQGRYIEAEAAAEQALVALGDVHDSRAAIDIDHLLASVAHRRGDYARARELQLRALAAAEAIGDERGIIACLHGLSVALSGLGDLACADSVELRAVDMAERIGDLHGLTVGLNNLGTTAHIRGDYERAEAYYRRSSAIKEELGDQTGLAVTLINLGELALFRGDLQGVDEYSRRSLPVLQHTADQYALAFVRGILATAAHLRGRLDEAVKLCRASLELRDHIGDRPGMIECWITLAEIARDRGWMVDAAQLYRRARRSARGKMPELEARVALGLAQLQLCAGRPDRVTSFLAEGVRIAQTHGLRRHLVKTELLASTLYLTQSMPTEAYLRGERAIEQAHEMGLRLEEAVALRLVGDAQASLAHYDDAEARLRHSLQMLGEIGARLELARTQLSLAHVIMTHQMAPSTEALAVEARTLVTLAHTAFSESGAALPMGNPAVKLA